MESSVLLPLLLWAFFIVYLFKFVGLLWGMAHKPVSQWSIPNEHKAPYEIRITRQDPPLTWDEWSRLVEGDHGLSLSHENQDGSIERLRHVKIEGHPGLELFWQNDTLSAYGPNPEELDRLVEIADSLNAVVIGERDEQNCAGRQIISANR